MILMCTRFYIEPDNDETRELIAVALHSKLADAFIRGGSPKLAQLLNISNEQMSYITNAEAGCGLIKYGSALVPFINRFPKDTKLYQLMTTRPGEGSFAGGRAS